MACIQATTAGADEALMLDPHGFVATCNSTHFFIVRGGEVWTSSGAYCLGGITRGTVLRVAREAGIPAFEKQFSLTDVYGADEAFVTGTFAGLVPVREVDGRTIGDPDGDRPVIARLRELYAAAVAEDVAAPRPPAGLAREPADHGRGRPPGRLVGPPQHLDGADAGVGEPARHGRRRRAAVRPLPGGDRHRPPGRGGRDRRRGRPTGAGWWRRCWRPRPPERRSPTRSTWPTTCCPTSTTPGSASSPTCC